MIGQVKVHDWQDTTQREAAVTELQAFCLASVSRLKLEAFKPLKLKGAVDEWPAVDKWSLDWLVQQYGEQRSAAAACFDTCQRTNLFWVPHAHGMVAFYNLAVRQ